MSRWLSLWQRFFSNLGAIVELGNTRGYLLAANKKFPFRFRGTAVNASPWIKNSNSTVSCLKLGVSVLANYVVLGEVLVILEQQRGARAHGEGCWILPVFYPRRSLRWRACHETERELFIGGYCRYPGWFAQHQDLFCHSDSHRSKNMQVVQYKKFRMVQVLENHMV